MIHKILSFWFHASECKAVASQLSLTNPRCTASVTAAVRLAAPSSSMVQFLHFMAWMLVRRLISAIKLSKKPTANPANNIMREFPLKRTPNWQNIFATFSGRDEHPAVILQPQF